MHYKQLVVRKRGQFKAKCHTDENRIELTEFFAYTPHVKSAQETTE